MVLADNIAPFVDEGFLQNPLYLSAVDIWTLAFLFGLQIYFDFSAYSSIAIGSALLMGIKIPENFNYPYFSSSPKEFWQRWDISLSSWIRDYLYLPLLGVRVRDNEVGGSNLAHVSDEIGSLRVATFALFLTWGIMGLWHGSTWGFIAWGIYHACLIFFYRKISIYINLPKNVSNFVGWIITLPLIMLSWILFRAKDLNDAFYMLSKVADFNQYSWLGMRENTYLVTATLFICTGLWFLTTNYLKSCNRCPYPLIFIFKTAFLSFVIFMVFIFFRPINQFIYFQF